MAFDPSWANPVTTRSRVMLEIASELVSGTDTSVRQAKVLLRDQGTKTWTLSLYGSGTMEGIDAVMSREADLGIINPSAALMLAHRGQGPFKLALPLRTIAVIPSLDQFVFAVRSDKGIESLEDIARKKAGLRISLRGDPRHGLNTIIHDITAAAGFTLDDIKSWGGQIRHEGPLPYPDGPRFAAFKRGEIDAIFDEASDFWVKEALEAGMTILPLSEATVKKLEGQGYRRGIIRKDVFPGLPRDLLSIDFSGWPIFTRADMDEKRVEQICAALDAAKHRIPWQGDGPLPVERMAKDAEDTPLDVPLHAGAERYWRSRGYL
jgi:TRAP-type uncharacterized transport system substrate-binding protein